MIRPTQVQAQAQAQESTQLSGYVLDMQTGEPVVEAQVIIKDRFNVEIPGCSRTQTDSTGAYSISLIADSVYHITYGVILELDTAQVGYVVVSDSIRMAEDTKVDVGISEADAWTRYRNSNEERWMEMMSNRMEYTRFELQFSKILINGKPRRHYTAWIQRI